ncbi:MAG: right-handed parallel beta-helix repeat-containing protein [Anaerolineales bacterium]|nr:right-handed parallel beta-helix repeat-containing protein [Anaerolineales bacterium]
MNRQTARAWVAWYVAPSGDDSWNCQSEATACRTIQAAINKAVDGDSVYVLTGTYSAATNGESFPITITNKSLEIFGNSSTTTIVDAAGSGQNIFSASGNSIYVRITAFTLQGGNRAIEHIGGSPPDFHIFGLVSYNVIRNNSVGIYTNNSIAEIKKNSFSGNTQSAIHNVNYNPSISENDISWNGSGGTSAAIYNDHACPVIVNNLLGWNNGTGVYNNSSHPIITNNTIAFNYGGSGVANFNSSNPQITNNIITSNGVYGIIAQSGSVPLGTYNNVWANVWGDYSGVSAGTGSISADPRFVSLLDAHLLCSSPAINAGNNSAPRVPFFDFDGNPRAVGGAVDMGAYEKQSDLFCPIHLPLILK